MTSPQSYFSSLASHPDVWQPTCAVQAEVVASEDCKLFVFGPFGCGKTDACFGAWIEHAERYGEAALGVIITPYEAHFMTLWDRARRLFEPLGAIEYVLTRTWRFQNGAELRFDHCFDMDGAFCHAGHAYSFMAVINAINVSNGSGVESEDVLDYLLALVRSPSDVNCRMIVTYRTMSKRCTWLCDWAENRQFRFVASPLLDNPFIIELDKKLLPTFGE